jgi:hypothetical protein
MSVVPIRGNLSPHRICLILISLFAISLLGSCATTNTVQTRKTPLELSSTEAIAILLDHSWFSWEWDRIGDGMGECVSAATSRKMPDARVLSPAAFRSAVFPGFDAAAVPGTPDTLALLMDHPEFRSRIESHGIRYLVLLRGGTKAIRHGAASCVGGYGAAGCFGAYWWDKTTEVEVRIMDARQGTVTDEITATAKGTPWVAVILIAPVGIPVSTEYPVCGAVAESIASHLSSGTTGRSGNKSTGFVQGTKK